MLYALYEMQQAAFAPLRLSAEAVQYGLSHPLSPAGYTRFGRQLAAAATVFERVTRPRGKPAWGLDEVSIDGKTVPVSFQTALETPFCDLLHVKRAGSFNDPKLLIVAPLSGHWATLLRGTVAEMMKTHDVYITDWKDARDVPLARGRFGLEDYIDLVRQFLTHLGPRTHLMAVCQPAVPALAAVALMAEDGDPAQPPTMTLMGGPIDVDAAPTVPVNLARQNPLGWFERNVVTNVPFRYPGRLRRVYPGFMQLTGFMTMNLDRHVNAHIKLFEHLVEGDGDSAAAHRKFYDEYLSVMDLPAEFYLETVHEVFQRRALATGQLQCRGRTVNPAAIRGTALFTVEGELDDISAPGQTIAAHRLCSGLADDMRFQYLQKACGHYGIFNGRRWREQIAPRVTGFIRRFDPDRRAVPVTEPEPLSASPALDPRPRVAA